jgi:hypothetical protein
VLYAYHDLSPHQFEQLVVSICYELLGAGVQPFAPGPDGGRDAKFVGTAQRFPSTAEPWRGAFIVQAKHTRSPIGKFSESDFSGAGKSSVLSKEMPRIKKLRDQGELDHYILFSNRALGAEANASISDKIRDACGVPNVHLVGVEALERFVKGMPQVKKELEPHQYDLPLRASPLDLANFITHIAEHAAKVFEDGRFQLGRLERQAFTAKNAANGLSDEYARTITKHHLARFEAIRKLLADPASYIALRSYEAAVADFAAALAAHRHKFETYDLLLDHLLVGLLERDCDLAANSKLARTVLYFMYWSCDIGTTRRDVEDDDAAS